MPKNHCVLETQTPSQIWVADKPPLLGGRSQQISATEFSQQQGFDYSESIFSPSSSIAVSLSGEALTTYASDIHEFLKHNQYDHVVLSRMADSESDIGWGAFARQSIKMGDIVAVYSGVISESTAIKDHTYSLTISSSDYCINALNSGGLARFFQHAPLDPDEEAENITTIGKSAETIMTLFKMAGTKITPQEVTLGMARVTDKAGAIAHLKQKTTENSNLKLAISEYEELEFSNACPESTVAFANTRVASIMVSGIPVCFLYASRDINAGEPLTFSYGIGNILKNNQGHYPVLFNKNGEILPKNSYTRKSALIPCKVFDQPPTQFLYPAKFFLQYDLLKRFPVAVFPGSYPQSNYFLRKQLVAANAINGEYSLLSPNTATLQLRTALADCANSIELFYTNPQAADNDPDLDIVDIVITAKSNADWKYLYHLIKPQVGDFCNFFEYTNEVLIKGVNMHTQRLHQFIQQISELKNNLPSLVQFKRQCPQSTPISSMQLFGFFANQPGQQERKKQFTTGNDGRAEQLFSLLTTG